jgi:hypothetical protein
MKILEFVSKFSDEQSCKEYFRDIRMKEGEVCKKCGCKKHCWLISKWQFQCLQSNFWTTLKSGTGNDRCKTEC